MAGLLAWRFAGALLYVTIGDSLLTRFVGGKHIELGFVLFSLVLWRGAWALANRRRRPLDRGRLSALARTVHIVLYALMLIVPGIALLHQFGSGKPFSAFGIPLFSERADKIDWMMIPADALHYWLGFPLLGLAVGHAAMAFLHGTRRPDSPLRRMA